MKSNEDKLYIELIELGEIYKFIVDNYSLYSKL
jgi:hypothetical protein